MGVLIVRGVFGDVARAGDFHGFAFVGDVFGNSVHRFAVVLVAKFSDRVEMFETETERIDEGMTALAILRLRQLRNLLAHGERWIEFRVVERDGHRRRLERTSNDFAREKNAAMNWRTLFRISEGRKQERMRDDAGTLLRIELHF